MKLKKIITVWLLAGLCIVGHSATAKASVEDTVISNQVTDENDISNGTVDFMMEDEVLQKEEVVSQGAIEVVSGAAITMVTEPAVTVVTEPAVSNVVSAVSNVASAVSNVASEEKKTETVTKNETVTTKTTTTVKKVETKKSKKTTKKKYTKAELRLMSCIIYAEANGEPYAGKLAVGIVVMNRKSSKSFPNTVKGVIYQKYQFGPVRNGSLKRAFKEYDAGRFTSSAEKACIKAAKEALNGTKKVKYGSKTYNMKGYYYFSTYVKGKRLTIKNHQFK